MTQKSEIRSRKSEVGKFFFCFLISGFCFLISGCGFEPVYGVNRNTDISAEQTLSQVEIDNIGNREGQYLRNALIDRFYRYGRPIEPVYVLSVSKLREHVSGLDITRQSNTTRSQLMMAAEFTLTDRRTGARVLERNLRTITSYNVLGSEFATRVTEENARQNALDDLARQIELQLDLYFKREN